MAHTHSIEVTLSERGRLVLPASVRHELGLDAGSRLLLTAEDDGSLRLRPYRAAADGARGLLAHVAAAGSLVDDLEAGRRSEAEREP